MSNLDFQSAFVGGSRRHSRFLRVERAVCKAVSKGDSTCRPLHFTDGFLDRGELFTLLFEDAHFMDTVHEMCASYGWKVKARTFEGDCYGDLQCGLWCAKL